MIIIIILIVILLLLTYYIKYNNKELFENKKYYDCIISINIHHKPKFLLLQLDNIKEHVKCNYAVILNCNEYMYNECKNMKFSENIYINNEVINKQRYKGTLLKGHYSNIQFALNNFNFKYFIICSGRNFFDNIMTIDELNKVIKLGQYTGPFYGMYDKNNINWHWPLLIKTKLSMFFLEKNKNLYNSPHEGLLFSYNSCLKIVNFLENNEDIKINLFNYNASVEEFALQTIIINFNESFYYIGNGCCTEEVIGKNTDTDIKFMYKVKEDWYE
uniref:Nucleotide-diphospho-sugar transferase domain-containing protein n=1 Tax=viral metagenome TaxID=1070528 RepID=A0A6C0JP74_9ZZZZ